MKNEIIGACLCHVQTFHFAAKNPSGKRCVSRLFLTDQCWMNVSIHSTACVWNSNLLLRFNENARILVNLFWRAAKKWFGGSCCVNSTAVSGDGHKSDCFIMGSLVSGHLLSYMACRRRETEPKHGRRWMGARRGDVIMKPAGRRDNASSRGRLPQITAYNYFCILRGGGGETILQIFCDFCRKNTHGNFLILINFCTMVVPLAAEF